MKVRKLNVEGAKKIIEPILELQGPWGVVEWVNLRRDDPTQHILLLRCAFQALKARDVRVALTLAEEILEAIPADEKIREWTYKRYVRLGEFAKAEAMMRPMTAEMKRVG